MILPDYLEHSLDVVFCGTAAGNASAGLGHYYAGRGNKFWGVLSEVGLVAEGLGPESDHRVVEYRIGLTDLVKLHSGNDNTLRRPMYDVTGFEAKIQRFAPRYAAFNGKRAAAAYLGLRDTGAIQFGALDRSIGDTALYVLPSTSGSASGVWDIGYWRRLATLIAKTRST